jgi:hypothetical protein
MPNSDFQNLVEKEKYQVFLFTSPCSLPISCFAHPFFVINKKGNLWRYEIIHRKSNGKSDNHFGHLIINFFPLFSGVNIIPYYFKHFYFKAKLRDVASGDEGSEVKKMIDFIENSPNVYPYINKYRYMGPNSNTYTQWVLDHFKNLNFKLPWNAFGKGFKI